MIKFLTHKSEHRGIYALMSELTYEIVELQDAIKSLRADIEDLTDFVEDNLD